MSSPLSYHRLCELVEAGVITNVKHEQINAASIDVTLGNKILVERTPPNRHNTFNLITLRNRSPLQMNEIVLQDGNIYTLQPGQFILASTEQVFNLPNNIAAEYKMKSSMARIGLNHSLAGWCDPGWNGSVLTLEMKNITQYQPIGLQPGDAIGQMIFYEVDEVPADRSYAARGRYNNDEAVSGIKK